MLEMTIFSTLIMLDSPIVDDVVPHDDDDDLDDCIDDFTMLATSTDENDVLHDGGRLRHVTLSPPLSPLPCLCPALPSIR